MAAPLLCRIAGDESAGNGLRLLRITEVIRSAPRGATLRQPSFPGLRYAPSGAINLHSLREWEKHCLFIYRLPHPHPYFGCKFLVFLSLQTGLRCKIVKTKEFPAKSSSIRSYVTFRPLMTTSAWSPWSPNARDQGAPSGAMRTCRDDLWESF